MCRGKCFILSCFVSCKSCNTTPGALILCGTMVVLEPRPRILGHLAVFSHFPLLQCLQDYKICYFLRERVDFFSALNGERGSSLQGNKCPFGKYLWLML